MTRTDDATASGGDEPADDKSGDGVDDRTDDPAEAPSAAASPSTRPDSPTATPSRATARRRIVAGAVAAALVLTVVLIVRLTGDDVARPAVGDFLAEDSPYSLVDVDYVDRELELPSGDVQFDLYPPVGALDESEFDDELGLTAEGDGVFVGIDWDVGFSDDLVLAAAAEDGELAILIHGQRYPLGPLVDIGPRLPERSGFLVAPAGTGFADVILEVRFDGRTQTINAGTGNRDATAAELAPAEELAVEGIDDVCPEASAESTSAVASARCRYGRVALVPYVSGLGWAEEGQLWVTMTGDLSIDIDPPMGEDELAYYRPTGGALTFALDGSAPDQVNQSYEFGVLSFRVAFAVPVDQRAFTLLASGEVAGQLYDSADNADLPPTVSTPLSVAMSVEVP